ncbi:MAG: AsmA family protein, partial [Burkholderiales bacterium]|nr:AsmA family protein [Burkholderiales bacterium]
MKILKYALYGAGGLVLLAAIALAGLAAVVDGPFVKTRLERYLKEQKNRTLKIEGEPRLRIFPVAGLALGKTVLSEPGSDRPFLSLDSAEFALRVMPLFAGNVALEQVSIAGLNLEVRKGKDGRMNFDDLAGPGREPGTEARPERGERGSAPRFAVGRLSIDRGRIAYRDEASGQDLVIEGLNARLGPLEDGAASPLSLALSIAGHRPEVAIKVAVSGEARLDSARGALAVSKFDARVGGSAATMKGLDLRLTGNLAAG